MGLLVAFGDDANFVVSVGGFHPRFNPPPLPFPNPVRIAVDIINQPLARIRVMGYFAVTSNTVQFGAQAELYFGFSAFSVQGHIGFDVLIQFSPFYLIAEISASVSLKAFGVGVFSIRLRFSLEGPTPWRARGTGSISLLFFEISADFDITWGETRDTSLPPIAVIPLLKAELEKPGNWQALVPATNSLLVALRELDEADDGLVLHPVGTLRVSQKAVPLDLDIDKLGSQKISDANRFTLDVAAGGLGKKGDAEDQFAIAQYQEMDDASKLSRPAFQREHSGVDLSVDGDHLSSSRAVKRIIRYEEIIDNNYLRFVQRFVVDISGLFAHFLNGASVSSPPVESLQSKFKPYADAIVRTRKGSRSRSRRITRRLARRRRSPARPGARLHEPTGQFRSSMADAVHVIPQFEVTS